MPPYTRVGRTPSGDPTADQKLLEDVKLMEEVQGLEGDSAPQPSTTHKILEGVINTGGAAGKLMDTTGALPRAGLAMALQSLTGKQVFKPEELANAYNPTNLDTFPMSDKLYERAGVPKGAQLSDYLDMYEVPQGGADRWWVPNKGGFLDPTIRGTGGFATDSALDLANLVSGGAAGVLKQGAKNAWKQAMLKRVAEESGIQSAKTALEQTVKSPGVWSNLKDAAVTAARYPSIVAQKAGKKIYESGLQPIIRSGEKYGKDAGETLFQKGYFGSAANIAGRAENDKEILSQIKNKLLTQADEAGAKVHPEQVFRDFESHLNGMVNSGQLYQDEADKILENFRTSMGEGPWSATKTSGYKTKVGKEGVPQRIRDPQHIGGTPSEVTANKELEGILRGGTERAVEDATGQGLKLAETNRELGDLLTTGSAMRGQAQKERDAAKIGLKDLMLLFGGNAAGGPAAGGGLFTAKKLYDIIGPTRVKTSLGMLTRKAAESRLAPLLIDMPARQLVDRTLKKSPPPDLNDILQLEKEQGPLP